MVEENFSPGMYEDVISKNGKSIYCKPSLLEDIIISNMLIGELNSDNQKYNK